MDQKETAEVIYTCSMHPEIESKEPGKCPKCGMELVKKGENSDGMMNDQSDSTHHH